MADFLVIFLAICLAEFGDKTQVAILSLTLKTNHHARILMGVMLAFALIDGSAIVLGTYITHWVDTMYVSLVAGLVFIIMGAITLRQNTETVTTYQVKNPFLTSFGLIVLLELGDKSQIASGAFATQYHPVLVFFAVMTAMLSLSMLAIYAAQRLHRYIKTAVTARISGILFIIIGIIAIVRALT